MHARHSASGGLSLHATAQSPDVTVVAEDERRLDEVSLIGALIQPDAVHLTESAANADKDRRTLRSMSICNAHFMMSTAHL